jgi:hypothetical protein
MNFDPTRSDPNRSDWLANVWVFITKLEERVERLEEIAARLEAELSKPKPVFMPRELPIDIDD